MTDDFFLIYLFPVSSPAIIALTSFPLSAITLLSTTKISFGNIPAFIIELPDARTNTLDAECFTRYWLRSILSAHKSSAGDGKPAATLSVYKGIS